MHCIWKLHLHALRHHRHQWCSLLNSAQHKTTRSAGITARAKEEPETNAEAHLAHYQFQCEGDNPSHGLWMQHITPCKTHAKAFSPSLHSKECPSRCECIGAIKTYCHTTYSWHGNVKKKQNAKWRSTGDICAWYVPCIRPEVSAFPAPQSCELCRVY